MTRVEWVLLCCFAGACGMRTIGRMGDTGDQVAGAPASSGAPSVGEGGQTATGGRPSGEDGDHTQENGGAAGERGAAKPPLLDALPIAHFKLDECDGPALDAQSDATGVREGVQCGPGVQGSAAVFPGGGRIEFANEPRFDFTYELTVAAWVKPLPGGPTRSIVNKYYNLDAFHLLVREVGDAADNISPRYVFTIVEPENQWGRPSEVISPMPVELGVWTHVAGVYRWSPNGEVGKITLYVNGEPVAESGTKVGGNGLQQSSRPIQIGFAEPGASFVGSIDDVRLYDVALGPELAWLYLDPAHE